MRHRWGSPQEQIQKLEQELWAARYAILELAPAQYRQLLRSYYRCKKRTESYHWIDSVAEQIIDSANPIQNPQDSYFGPRAYCPLCGDGTSSPYENGFALPEGLRRHLVGWGQSQKCIVTEAAHQLALDYFHDQFSAAEETERLEKEKIKNHRMATEILLRTGPTEKPSLLDEVGYLGEPRNTEGWKKAESRLQKLGFKKAEENRIREYVRDENEYGIFADPRNSKEILFRVYRKPYPKRPSRKRINRSQYFSIKDSWKNDIPKKFMARLEAALANL